jgi:predicted transcriptional regulator
MASTMRKSKLELYQEILEGLKSRPMSVDCLSYETSTDCAVLKQRLDFLVKNGLVRERILKKGETFAISERGLAVLKALDLQKHLEQVKTAMMAVDKAMQAGITVSEQQRKNK